MDPHRSYLGIRLARAQQNLSSLAREPRIQTRLQAGSSLALGVGLLLSAALVSGIFANIQALVSDLIYLPHTPSVVEQDRLVGITMIFLVALLAGATLPHVRILTAAGLIIFYFIFYLGYAYQLYNSGILVQPVYPLLALIFTFVGTMVYRYFDQDRQRGRAERLLRRHAPSEALQTFLQAFDRGTLQIQGTRKVVTLLHVDMREFAAQLQALSTTEAVALVDEYLSAIVGVIFRHDGMLVRQTGSAVLAAWNLPLGQPGHAVQAVRAALELCDQVNQMNAKQMKELAVGIGMGISTGTVLAGCMGPKGHAEYTVIGQAMMIAEQLAMRKDGMIFFDDATCAKLDLDEFDVRPVTPLRLRRVADPLNVWQIMPQLELEPLAEAPEMVEDESHPS